MLDPQHLLTHNHMLDASLGTVRDKAIITKSLVEVRLEQTRVLCYSENQLVYIPFINK